MVFQIFLDRIPYGETFLNKYSFFFFFFLECFAFTGDDVYKACRARQYQLTAHVAKHFTLHWCHVSHATDATDEKKN